MLVQRDGRRAPIAGILLGPENGIAVGVKEPTPDELVYAAAGAERGIQGQPRVGPLPSLVSELDDGILDPRVLDVNEAFRERPVAGDQLFTNSERIHACSPC